MFLSKKTPCFTVKQKSNDTNKPKKMLGGTFFLMKAGMTTSSKKSIVIIKCQRMTQYLNSKTFSKVTILLA